MNGTVLNEIKEVRNNKGFIVNYDNTNRYRLSVFEENLSQTSYYFSSPIYNLKSRQLVSRNIVKIGNIFQMTGSNADICIGENEVMLKNDEALVQISADGFTNNMTAENIEFLPALNGIAVKVKNTDGEFDFCVKTDRPFMKLRNNTKYFALMSEDFRPYMTVSAIGAFDSKGNIFPLKVSCQKIDDQNYTVRVSGARHSERSEESLTPTLMFEINLYEPKLFQDTTVESRNPGENNAFGSMGFIGRSDGLGQQWLYSRVDSGKIPEILNTEINKAILHIPKYNDSDLTLTGYGISARFCSFGSNWGNKIRQTCTSAKSSLSEKYCSLDITDLISNKKTGSYKASEGFVLKSDIKNGVMNDFMAIATGDNYYTPQILEIS